jgi:hypothetical protein
MTGYPFRLATDGGLIAPPDRTTGQLDMVVILGLAGVCHAGFA